MNTLKFRAKLQVSQVAQDQYGNEIIKASPVYGGTPEDNSFSKATPSGELSLTISNPDLIGKIKPGMKFYADFSIA